MVKADNSVYGLLAVRDPDWFSDHLFLKTINLPT